MDELLRHKAAGMKAKGPLLSEKVHYEDNIIWYYLPVFSVTSKYYYFCIDLYNKLWLSTSGDESDYQRLRHFSYNCSGVAVITQSVYLSKPTKLCL